MEAIASRLEAIKKRFKKRAFENLGISQPPTAFDQFLHQGTHCRLTATVGPLDDISVSHTEAAVAGGGALGPFAPVPPSAIDASITALSVARRHLPQDFAAFRASARGDTLVTSSLLVTSSNALVTSSDALVQRQE